MVTFIVTESGNGGVGCMDPGVSGVFMVMGMPEPVEGGSERSELRVVRVVPSPVFENVYADQFIPMVRLAALMCGPRGSRPRHRAGRVRRAPSPWESVRKQLPVCARASSTGVAAMRAGRASAGEGH